MTQANYLSWRIGKSVCVFLIVTVSINLATGGAVPKLPHDFHNLKNLDPKTRLELLKQWTKSEDCNQPQCVMYDKCKDPSDPFDAGLPCVYHGPPRRLDEDTLATLEPFCPELIDEYGEELCCSPDQVVDLVTNLALPRDILQDCPSCYYNFRQSFCYFTCSPEQSDFVRINETETFPGKDPGQEIVRVKKVNMIVTEAYVNGTYDSCKNVIMSSANAPAMDFLCGPWASRRCDPKKWFDYMGTTENGFSPFDIFYNYLAPGEAIDGYRPFNEATFQCSEVPPGACHACSNRDCFGSYGERRH